MKRTMLIVILVLLAFGVMSCAPVDSAPDTVATEAPTAETEADLAGDPAAAESTGNKIFMSNAYYTAPYCAPLNKGVQDEAARLGYEIQIVDGEGSADKQMSQFKAAEADGYDAFIYFPADQASTPSIVDYLNSTDKPYVVLNSRVDPSVEDKVVCTVASDEVEIGRNIGKMANEYLDGKGNAVYIEGAAGASYTENVTKGVMEVLEGTDIKILNERQYSDWDPGKSMKLMEDFLTKYGADQIDIVICQDGGMFQGALSALKAQGLDKKIMCAAAGNDLIIKDSIMEGSLLGTSIQDPFVEGALGVSSLDKIMKGESVDNWVVTPGGICYKEELDKYNWF